VHGAVDLSQKRSRRKCRMSFCFNRCNNSRNSMAL